MTKASQEVMWSDLRVGLLAFSALLVLIFGIAFAGGDKGLFLQKKVELKAFMSNIGSLKRGSSVTMSGMAIGQVTKIAFVESSKENKIEVTMQLRSDVRSRVKTDSVPSVRTQGMLGDRYVDISPGTAESGLLPEGGILLGESATDFDQTLNKALDVMVETEKILKSINDQKGSVGQFFYDQRFYDNLVMITEELDLLVKDFKKHPRKYIKFSVF